MKNITIQEGGVVKNLTADKLKTNLVGGGTCNWVPEDETQLITKSVTKNGTYKASSDGAYGYSKVIVNVAGGGSVSGKGSDGNTHNYSTDDQGNIVDEVIPDTIAVTTPPTNPYGIYQNGQTITTDGMVVKAYNADETEYGTVPNDEITINPTTAVYDSSTDDGGYYTAESELNVDGYNQPFTFGNSLHIDFQTARSSIEHDVSGTDCHMAFFVRNSSMHFLFASSVANKTVRYTTKIDGIVHSDETISLDYLYVYDGRVVYYNNISPTSYDSTINTNPAVNIGTKYFTTQAAEKAAWTLAYGDIVTIPAGSRQTITVTWPRPGDGKELTTTFEIRVAPGYTPGDNTEL